MMLHTKYHGYKPLDFREEDFSMFFPTSLFKTIVTPGAGPFLTPGV